MNNSTVAEVFRFDGKSEKFESVSVLKRPPVRAGKQSPPFVWTYHLPRGGTIRVYLSLVKGHVLRQITRELDENKNLYRSYPIQCGVEPR